ncbi:hypothetical protein [Actinoallomurus iriomotensis]|uniref:Uncharacterized protein n=1 Tax=Actinoallomurus iriomotensis TaxID=478107 RepID=A0A9W6VZH9_9ACTN|nr:hypothetical protein [Actinoallomurus iriomotensis]GLY85910.1 hypothetical protein Airi02_038390 [Actinoallomurus iriomotensis]
MPNGAVARHGAGGLDGGDDRVGGPVVAEPYADLVEHRRYADPYPGPAEQCGHVNGVAAQPVDQFGDRWWRTVRSPT